MLQQETHHRRWEYQQSEVVAPSSGTHTGRRSAAPGCGRLSGRAVWRRCESSCQLSYSPTQRRVRYGAVSCKKLDCFTTAQLIGVIAGCERCDCHQSISSTLEEECDRHSQRLAELVEAAGADTIFPMFVFVDLLERKTQGCRQLRLAYSQHDSSLMQPRCDMQIDRSKSFSAPWHRSLPFDESLPDCFHKTHGPRVVDYRAPRHPDRQDGPYGAHPVLSG